MKAAMADEISCRAQIGAQDKMEPAQGFVKAEINWIFKLSHHLNVSSRQQ